jgi:hypothetical protein
LKEQNIFFSYFQVDQNYYLFLYRQESIDINFLYQSVDVIQEFDSKQRKIRSLRGFFLYALEILENGKDYEILETNLQSFFWRKVKNIIRQNQKGALLEFLFGKDQDHKSDSIGSSFALEELQNQLSSLQQKVLDLEAKLMTIEPNFKYALSDPSRTLESSKISQHRYSTLKSEKEPNLAKNDSQVRDSTSWGKDMESKSFSDASKIDFKALSKSNELNFITFVKISEEENIEIIQLGFKLNQEGKISLKKYYEGTGESSLFQLKGYSIKYEAIRKNKFYQSLKA